MFIHTSLWKLTCMYIISGLRSFLSFFLFLLPSSLSLSFSFHPQSLSLFFSFLPVFLSLSPSSSLSSALCIFLSSFFSRAHECLQRISMCGLRFAFSFSLSFSFLLHTNACKSSSTLSLFSLSLLPHPPHPAFPLPFSLSCSFFLHLIFRFLLPHDYKSSKHQISCRFHKLLSRDKYASVLFCCNMPWQKVTALWSPHTGIQKI